MKKKQGPKKGRSKFVILSEYLRPFRSELIVLSIIGVLSSIANGFLPYVTGRFFDALIDVSNGVTGEGSIPLWLTFLALWGIVQLLATHSDWFIDRSQQRLGLKLYMSSQVKGFEHLLQLPMQFHESARINENIEVVNKVGWRIEGILHVFINMAPQFLSVLIGVVLTASIYAPLAGVLAFGVFLYVMVLVWRLRPMAAFDEKAHSVWNQSYNDAAVLVHQVESVKQASAEEYEVTRIRSSFLEKTFGLWARLENMWSNISYFQRIIVFATQLTVFIFSVGLIEKGVITIGELVTLNGYTLMFFGPFVQLGSSWKNLQNGLTAVGQADEQVYSKEREVYEPENAAKVAKISGEVEYRNVQYQYEEGKKDVLKNINIHVRPGEVVAFVGESGVGKSTAISLISGYYFPTEGEVLIDGVDTRLYNLHNLRSHIGVVPQEVALFNESILDNIRYGTFRASKKAVIQAAKDAHIHDFVESLPRKYNTLVGERGVKLSVGQKQRVAIARAMLRNPSILILDEPTSALDAQTEDLIAQSLKKLMKGRTTFIIAHRLSTVRSADKIYVFKNGRVVESGSHDELIKIKGGEYRHLHDLQIDRSL